MKTLITITCFAAAALITTSAQGRDVSGQVFIVTKAHESVKLGLVPISVYPCDAIQATIEAVDAALESEREEAKDLERGSNEAEKSAKAVRSQLWKEATSSPLSGERFVAAQSASNLEADISNLETTASRRENYLFGSVPYFRELNEHHRPVATAKTDADGKFTVSVPSDGEFALVAFTERLTPEGSERYYWVVPADHVDLTNDNLTSATSGASLLHVIGDDDYADPTVTKEMLQQKMSDIKTKYADSFAAFGNFPVTIPTPRPARFVTLRQDVLVQLPHGTVTLRAGTRIEFVSSDSSEVHVRYMNTEQAIPVSAVDVK